ncbi:MAG TPA: acyl carrier protein [Thermoguttaceae bacterium]|nr:acyl carrier protein [Thermoguttaceae bacterium]
MTDIQESLRQFIQENFLFGRELAISDDDSLMESGIVDSTGVLELIMFVESQFAITVDGDELVPENLDSIANLTRFITSKCHVLA